MQAYLIRRLIFVIPTLIGLTFIVFMAVRLMPGNIVDQMLADSNASAADRRQLEEQYGLHGNLAKQYVQWLGEIVSGDLGTSVISRRPTIESLRVRMPASMELGILAMLVSSLISIPVGVISAIRQNTALDYLSRSIAILLLAVPSFWLALLAMTYGFSWFHWAPPLRYKDVWVDPAANLQMMWAPALILGAGLSGSVMRLTRSTMLEVLRQDYVRTAWAKGLGERSVILRHVLRNAMIPVVTVIGLQIPIVVGGTVILERIFSIPGMGAFLLDSVTQRDYPTIQALVLISAVFIVLSNLLIDLAYPLIDPRITYSS